MGILFHCSECERPLNVGASMAGQSGVCPNCKETIQVPEDSEMVAAEFRTRLNHWNRRQPAASLPDPQAASRSRSAIVEPPVEKTSGGSGPIGNVTPDPVSPSGPSSSGILTESQKVARGISGTLRQSGPDPLAQSGDHAWYVRPPSGGQFGPASAHLVKQWVEQGRVTGDSFLWREGWEEWCLAADILPEFAGSVLGLAEETPGPNPVVAASARTAYMKARRRRTMLATLGLLAGTVVIILLLVVLFFVVQR